MRARIRSVPPTELWQVAPALALAAAIAVVDATVAGSVLLGLLVAPPLVVAAQRGPWQTAAVVGVCVPLAVVAGLWDHIFLTTDHLLRVLVVLVGGLLGVWIAAIRGRAERDRTYALFLAQSSVVFEEALHADLLLRRLADLAVPRLGDWCVIHAVGSDAAIESVISTPPDPTLARGTDPRRVLETGEPELIEDVRRELREAADLRSLGVRSLLCVPLRARGRTLATMTLASGETRRRFNHQDLARAMDLATIAAASLDNIRLLQQTEEARAALERAHERSSFLARAGEMLESSLEIERTLGDVARMLVPRYAEVCTVDVVGADGSIRRLGTIADDPDVQQALDELVASYAIDLEGQNPVSRVLRTGRTELIHELGDEVLMPIARDARHLELMRRAVGRTALLLPLRAHGRTAGVLSLRWFDPQRPIDPDDLALLEDLAARIALAADNARIYEERDSVARTLARSLLPTELPEIPGFDVAAHYLPATREPGISGDFYDAFALRNGRWVLLVGDVCGKGATAASLTALARHSLRTAAMAARRPARVLQMLNESMLGAPTQGRFCTVAYVQLEPRAGGDGGHVSVACGGHPPPLVVRRDGTIETVPAAGSIIGAFRDLSLHEADVELAAGDALVLFTDGVTESGTGSELLGDEALHEILLGCASTTAAQLAACLAQRAVDLQRGDPRDDIAVLALRALATP